MFNDPLTLEQCSELLENLVRCAFPFQCAHGRPSMVPIMDLSNGMVHLGNLVEVDDWEEDGDGTFLQVFKKWKATEQ